MKVSGIVKNTAKKGLEFVNSAGTQTRESIQGSLKNIGKAKDSFFKNSPTLQKGLNKDTVIGLALIATATTAAIALIKGIVEKVKEVKEK